MTGLTQTLGLAASIVSLVLWWPQALLVWRSRSVPGELRAVSVSSQVLLLVNAVLWGGYAVATQSWWVGAPGLVNAPLALLTMRILLRSRQPAADRSVDDTSIDASWRRRGESSSQLSVEPHGSR